MTKKNKIILGACVGAVVLAAAGAGIWYYSSGSAGSADAVYVQPISDVNAAGSGYVNRYSGVVETQRTLDVKFDSDRKLGELLVAVGDHVEEGDPLFTYETESVELEIEQGQLEITRLNTTIENSNNQIDELQKEMDKASSSDKPKYSAQIQELQATIAQSEYDIKTKEAEVERLQSTLDNSTVTAGMTGTIRSIADDPTSQSSEDISYTGESSAYITILADGDFRVKGTVSEQNIAEITAGTQVIVRSRADNTIWTGEVTEVDTEPTTNSSESYYYDTSSGESSSTYPFYVNLDSVDGLILGQHVTVEVNYGQADSKEGIWLDSGWIVQEDDSAYVWAAKEGGRLERRTVTLGEYDIDLDVYEITSGLDESDYIAWPDSGCTAGAATTTEYVFTDEDAYADEDFYEDEGYYDEGYYDEGYYDDSDVGIQAEDGTVIDPDSEEGIYYADDSTPATYVEGAVG